MGVIAFPISSIRPSIAQHNFEAMSGKTFQLVLSRMLMDRIINHESGNFDFRAFTPEVGVG